MANNNKKTHKNSLEDLSKPFEAITKSFSTMHRRLEKLNRVHNELIKFNDAFSAFLYGITVNNTAIEWTQAPSKKTIEEFAERNNTNASILESLGPVKESKEPTLAAMQIENTNKRKEPPTKDTRKSKRRFVSNVNIEAIINRLPLMYREQTEHLVNMRKLLKTLRLYPDGLSMKELVDKVKLPQYKVTTCINALVHSKDAIKVSEKGAYSTFLLDPEKFPSVENQ